MSFNQHPGPQNLSKQTSNSQTSGNRTSNNGQPATDTSNSHWTRSSPKHDSSDLNKVYHAIPGDANDNWTKDPLNADQSISIHAHHNLDKQESCFQNSNAQTPATRQPPTLPSIAATCGVLSHPGLFICGTHYRSNNNNTPATRSLAQAHVTTRPLILGSNNSTAAPLNWAQLRSNPFGYNPNHPWNNNSARAPPNPHPVVASATGHPAAAGYLPSTFTPGPVSARRQELTNGSTPLETSAQQSGMSNPLDAVGDNRRALRRAHGQLFIKQLQYFTARRKARMSNAQTEGTDLSQRCRTNSTATITVTEQPSRSEMLASLAEAARNGTLPPFILTAPANSETNEESDSPVGTDTPGSDEEAEYYDSSVCGEVSGAEYDGEEKDPRVDTEAVASEEELTNGFNPEGGLADTAQAIASPPRFQCNRSMADRDAVSDAPSDLETATRCHG